MLAFVKVPFGKKARSNTVTESVETAKELWVILQVLRNLESMLLYPAALEDSRMVSNGIV